MDWVILAIWEDSFDKRWNNRNKCFISKEFLTPKNRSDHHLKPRWEHRIRDGRTPCSNDRHMLIHRLFTNKQLYYYLNTEKKLKKTLNRVIKKKALADWFGGYYEVPNYPYNKASVAPMEEQSVCNRIGGGSNPFAGFARIAQE